MEKLARFYTCLGIAPGSSLERIRQAYADAEKELHAERFSDDTLVRRKAQEQLSAINEAYLSLVDAYQEVQASLAESRNQQLPAPVDETAPVGEATPRSCFTEGEAAGSGGHCARTSEHADDLGSAAPDTSDPAGPLKREMVRLFALLTAVFALLLIIRFTSCGTTHLQTAPLAPAPLLQPDPENIRRDAEQGNAKAQTLMGYLSLEGKGVRKDLGIAAKWFEKGAAQGNAEAQDWLGYLYETGQGVAQNYGEAARWYHLAAEQGNADAQKNLGLMYGSGRGVPQRDQEAERWLGRAAEQGNEEARKVLQSGQGR